MSIAIASACEPDASGKSASGAGKRIAPTTTARPIPILRPTRGAMSAPMSAPKAPAPSTIPIVPALRPSVRLAYRTKIAARKKL